MQVQALKENLQKPLGLVSRYISSRPALPVLANVLIEASETGLVLSSTNLDVTVKTEILAQTTATGKITVPAKPLAELMATLPAGKIDLSTTDTQLLVKAKDTEAAFNTITEEDFPVLPKFSQDNAISLPLQILKEIAENVLFAASTDESRPVLTTLLLRQNGSQVTFVATDGFRLSEVTKKVEAMDLEAGKTLLLPAKIIAELIKIGTDSQSDTLWIDSTSQTNQLAMKAGSVEFFSKLIDAAYPPYERIIPTEFVSTIELDSEALLQAVRLASVFARDAGSSIRLEVEPSQSRLVVIAQSAALGQNQSTISVKGDGEDLGISFNGKFLLDALAVFPHQPINLKFKGPEAPMMVQADNLPDFRHIIMPLKI